MKLHIITIGKPKLAYAQIGWDEYSRRLGRYHQLRATHVADKYANDANKILATAEASYKVALVVNGQQFSSLQLAEFMQKRELESREVSFIIGGPEGLPAAVIATSDFQWGLSRLTLPHDLAMVATLEALYRASTIAAGQPYHK